MTKYKYIYIKLKEEKLELFLNELEELAYKCYKIVMYFKDNDVISIALKVKIKPDIYIQKDLNKLTNKFK